MRRRVPAVSVCSMTNAEPRRVAATLEPLRGLDAEVILAVDDRVDPAWVDGYRRLADHVFLVPFPGLFARVFAWLFAQCSGRWVLQLDADEVPSPDLREEVEATIHEPGLTHAIVPCLWLYPDGCSYLSQWPWTGRHGLRLFRNDPALVGFPGIAHFPISMLGPRRYLRAPIYHADLVIHDLEARRRKVARYDKIRPGLVIDGRPLNEAFYLPELRPEVSTRPVPASDLPAIRRFLEPAPGGTRRWRRGRLSRVGADDLERTWSRRALPPEAYRASLHVLDEDRRVVAGEERTFNVEVENLGTERWPGGEDGHPLIRVGCRWVDENGEVVMDNLRTMFGEPVEPGARVLVPVRVMGDEGMRTLEIDVVHEFVTWFGAGIKLELEVEEPRFRRQAPT